jgi:hypothetical protein
MPTVIRTVTTPALNGLADDAERSLGDALQKLPVDRP